MAARRKAKKSTRARARRAPKPRVGFAQKAVVALAGMLLVLCAASVTYSFFFRHTGGGGGEFRIEVLNGTGHPGLAQAATRSLHRRGIDVIDYRNAPRFDYQESILVARKPGADVDKLGRILGCHNVVVQLQKDTIQDATLILGADFRDLNLDWELESDLLE